MIKVCKVCKGQGELLGLGNIKVQCTECHGSKYEAESSYTCKHCGKSSDDEVIVHEKKKSFTGAVTGPVDEKFCEDVVEGKVDIGALIKVRGKPGRKPGFKSKKP